MLTDFPVNVATNQSAFKSFGSENTVQLNLGTRLQQIKVVMHAIMDQTGTIREITVLKVHCFFFWVKKIVCLDGTSPNWTSGSENDVNLCCQRNFISVFVAC